MQGGSEERSAAIRNERATTQGKPLGPLPKQKAATEGNLIPFTLLIKSPDPIWIPYVGSSLQQSPGGKDPVSGAVPESALDFGNNFPSDVPLGQ
jgi:hypothetical protein